MTYQPPQNILAAILQSRKQQSAGQMPAQTQNVDMSQPQQAQLPQPSMGGASTGQSLLSSLSGLSGYAPGTTFGYQNPQGGPTALNMISQVSGYAPNTTFGYGSQQQAAQPQAQSGTQPVQQSQNSGIMSILKLIGGM